MGALVSSKPPNLNKNTNASPFLCICMLKNMNSQYAVKGTTAVLYFLRVYCVCEVKNQCTGTISEVLLLY